MTPRSPEPGAGPEAAADRAVRAARRACASWTCPRSSPGRTARCSWATWARTSSRWSRPPATRRASTARPTWAGARTASRTPTATRARTPATAVSPPTTCPSTATSGAWRWTCAATAGREALRRLIARSDVLIENFRAGAFDRMGFTDAELERLNPGLVRLSITGYGPAGVDADKPGFDFIIQAASGLMSHHGCDGRGRRRPHQGGRGDRGPRHRDAGRDARPGGAAGADAAGADRTRPAHRPRAARRDRGVARQPGRELAHRRARAGSHGQCPPEHHALRDVPHGGRGAGARGGRPSGSGCASARRSGMAAPGHGPAVPHERRARRAPRGAAAHPRRDPGRPADRRLAGAPDRRGGARRARCATWPRCSRTPGSRSAPWSCRSPIRPSARSGCRACRPSCPGRPGRSAGHHPCSRSTARRSWPTSASGPTRSHACAPAAAGGGVVGHAAHRR